MGLTVDLTRPCYMFNTWPHTPPVLSVSSEPTQLVETSRWVIDTVSYLVGDERIELP